MHNWDLWGKGGACRGCERVNEHSMNMTRRSVENGLGHCFVSAVNSQALMVIRMNAITPFRLLCNLKLAVD